MTSIRQKFGWHSAGLRTSLSSAPAHPTSNGRADDQRVLRQPPLHACMWCQNLTICLKAKGAQICTHETAGSSDFLASCSQHFRCTLGYSGDLRKGKAADNQYRHKSAAAGGVRQSREALRLAGSLTSACAVHSRCDGGRPDCTERSAARALDADACEACTNDRDKWQPLAGR